MYVPKSLPLPYAIAGFNEMLPIASVPLYVASAVGIPQFATSFVVLLLLVLLLMIGSEYFQRIRKASCVECGNLFALRSQKVVDNERVDRGDVTYSDGRNERRVTSDFVKGTRLLKCKDCGTPHIANTGRIETHGSGHL